MTFALDGTTAAPDEKAWLAAAKALGVSPLMMKRYDLGLRHIEGIAKLSRRSVESLLPSSFTAAELAIRLYGRDKSEGLRVLSALADGMMTIEGVRDALDATPAKPGPEGDRARALRERAEVIQRCEEAVRNAGRLFERGAVVRRRPAMRVFRRVGFEVFTPLDELVSGADLYLSEPRTVSRNEYEGVAQSVLLSQYLPSFTLIFAPGFQVGAIASIERALVTLGASWIGTAVIENDGTVARRRTPRGKPVPDRTAEYRLLRDALSQNLRRNDGSDPLA